MLQGEISLPLYATKDGVTDIAISCGEIFRPAAYESVRRLFGIYDQACLILPRDMPSGVLDYLRSRHAAQPDCNSENRYQLEADLFGHISRKLDKIAFASSYDDLEKFCRERIEEEDRRLADGVAEPLCEAIRRSPNAEYEARDLLAQCSMDFLTEASPLARYMPGSFGGLQMAMFRILMDEYGEARLEAKHSQLFSRTLKSAGMSDRVGAYESYYNLSTYLLMNFNNYLCTNQQFFFRYLGALFLYEACLINVTKQQGELLKDVLGAHVDTEYFSAHVAIDQNHGRWVFNELIAPAVAAFGDEIIPEILRGYAELSIYQALAGLEAEHLVTSRSRIGTAQQAEVTDGTVIYAAKDLRYMSPSGANISGGNALIRFSAFHQIELSAAPGHSVEIPPHVPVWITTSGCPVRIHSVNV